MREVIKKSFLLGLGAISLTKSQAEKIIRDLVKKNAVTIKEGREMLSKVKKTAENERRRVKKFAVQEARRLAGKLGNTSKSQLGRLRKTLKVLDKKLSSRGKKALKKALREISR